MFDGAIAHGVRSGITVPVRGPFSQLWMLTLASSLRKPPLFRSSEIEILRTATVLTHCRLAQTVSPPIDGARAILSAQEVVCLTWAANGKYMPEIAEITRLRYRTVQHYLDSARRKLGAINLVQAVCLAKDYGLIT